MQLLIYTSPSVLQAYYLDFLAAGNLAGQILQTLGSNQCSWPEVAWNHVPAYHIILIMMLVFTSPFLGINQAHKFLLQRQPLTIMEALMPTGQGFLVCQ